MAVEGVTSGQSVYNNVTTPTTEANAQLSLTDFYTLLAAQMKYQDADNPMDTSEMMASMVQTQMIQAINDMNSMQMTTYAASMIGKEVTIAEVDSNGQYKGEVEGTVTSVLLGSSPMIFIGDKAYYLNQIMSIGTLPKGEGDGENSGETENEGSGDDAAEGVEGTEGADGDK